MKKSRLLGAVCACLAIASSNASAIPVGFVENAGYTTDTSASLEWLDFTHTQNRSYADVLLGIDTLYGGGWRYASNNEVEDLFGKFFPTLHTDTAQFTGPFTPDLDASFNDFTHLFGYTYNYYNRWSDGDASSYDYSAGLYKDEDGQLRELGFFYSWSRNCSRDWRGRTTCSSTSSKRIEGLESTGMFSNDSVIASKGFLVVRDIGVSGQAVVPIPAAAWLFGSGLLGLIGISRRKKA